jgi:hypothetical protein
MSDKHYSDDDLVARVFGLDAADGHLDTCESCNRRLDLFRRRHLARHVLDTEVPAGLLADQRRAVYSRLLQAKPRRFRSGWVPVPVAAMLLVVAMFTVFRPAAQKQSADAISEDQALQDVFTAASGTATTGLKPVKFLFEVKK